MTAHVDETVLARLRRDVGGDAATVRRFARNFVSHWAERTARLEQALAESSTPDADVVLLSIRSSSRMLGAAQLEAESARMLGALARDDLAGCRRCLPELGRIGDETCLELTELFRSA